MIISIRLFLPGKSFSPEVASHIQQVVADKLIQIKFTETKYPEIKSEDFCRVKIITHPLYSIQEGKATKDDKNRIEIKRNGTNLFRKTLDSFKKEADKFEAELLKEISIYIGNNLKIIY
jgi:hypothetical protein